MAQYRILRDATTGQIILPRVRLATNFFDHLRGLMFVPALPEDEGLLFVYGGESKTNTSIHMLFMNFDIGVVWLDSRCKVVDLKLAKRWRPAYAPLQPAQYFVEANPSVLERVQVGAILRFDELVTPAL